MDFIRSLSTNKNTQALIQMQETIAMFQAVHEFNDIGRTSDSCWFSFSMRDFPLHQHICIQLQNKKRIKRTRWLQLRCKSFPAFAMNIQISPCGNTFHPQTGQKSAFLLMRKNCWSQMGWWFITGSSIIIPTEQEYMIFWGFCTSENDFLKSISTSDLNWRWTEAKSAQEGKENTWNLGQSTFVRRNNGQWWNDWWNDRTIK